MPASNDLADRTRTVRDLIRDDRISDALNQLMDLVSDFADDRTEVIIISANYRRVEKAYNRQELKFDEADQQRTRLLRQMLRLIDDVELRPRLPVAS